MEERAMVIEHHGRKLSGTVYLPEADHFPIVICSHGFNGCGDDFKSRAQALTQSGIGAVAYDFCGGSLRSKSDLKTSEMTVFTEKEDLCAVLDTVRSWQNADPGQIFVLGESMGGLVTALTAEERGAEIQGMALLYPAFCVADDWNRRFPNIEDIPEIEDLWNVPLGRKFFQTLHGFQVFENIGTFAGPTLIMHGDCDPVVPVSYSRKADEIYPHSRLEIFENEGHGFSAAGNERVNRMLVDFVCSNSIE